MSERNQARKRAAAQRRKKRRLALVVILTLLILFLAGVLVFAVYRMFLSPGTASSSVPSGGESAGQTTAAGQTAATTTTGAAASTGTTTREVTAEAAANYVQKDRSVWNLLLVNDHNPVPDNYLSTITIADYNGPSKQCDSRIVEPLREMLNAGNAYDPSFKLSAASLYRTVELQAKNYNNKVNEYKRQGYDQETAEIKAATVIKRPGESEHNTGLCVDLLGAGYASLEQSFANTKAYEWLKAHCAEYGFILRYPEDKEDITAVIFEPWHYRYVGVEAATEIMERGITLEEYVAERGM